MSNSYSSMFGSKPETLVTIHPDSINYFMEETVKLIKFLHEHFTDQDNMAAKERDEEADARVQGKIACLRDKLVEVEERIAKKRNSPTAHERSQVEAIEELRMEVRKLERQITGLGKHGKYYTEY